MPGLVPPPKQDRPSRVIARFLGLIVMLAAVATFIWNYTTQNNIELVEVSSVESLRVDPESLISVDGLRIRVVQHADGATPLILLHDVDVGGSVAMGDVATAADGFRALTVDLPGFGLSTRITEPGHHRLTIAGMAEVVGGVVEQLGYRDVVVAGVGFGGWVAADLAVRRPDLVAGLVLVDTDFWAADEWRQRAQRLPIIGPSMTYTYETLGRFSQRVWAPHCAEGGWCPTPQQVVDRDAAARIRNSTKSIHAFWNTPQASLIPSDLDEIRVPTVYVWSIKGPVPRESVDRIIGEVPSISVIQAEAWAAHLEAPATVIDAARVAAGR